MLLMIPYIGLDNNMKTPKQNVLHMKIDDVLKAQLRELAQHDNRTLANYVETVLREHVRQKEGELRSPRYPSPA